MTKLMKIMIVSLGALILATGISYALEDNEGQTAVTFTGEADCGLSTPQSTTMSAIDHEGTSVGPIEGWAGLFFQLDLWDNKVTTAGADGTILYVKMDPLPLTAQYGSGPLDDFYFFVKGAVGASWNPATDNEETDVAVLANDIIFDDTDNHPVIMFGASPNNNVVLAGRATVALFLHIAANKRIYGGTSDSAKVTFTLVETD